MLSLVLIDIPLAAEATHQIPDIQAPVLLLLLLALLTPVVIGNVWAFVLCIFED